MRIMDSSNVFYIYRQDNPTNYSHTEIYSANRTMAYSFRLGKYVYELVNIHFNIQEYVHFMGVWRINRAKKAILKMSLSEINKLYRMLDAEPEIKDFALIHCDKYVRFEILHPFITKTISIIYRPLALITKKLSQHNI